MYSLAQKRMLAKQAGETEVVLTMEEAEATLANITELDRKLAEYSEYLPEEVIRKECEELFGPRPDDSRKRCVYCNELPVDCCDANDGSFYWVEE